MSPVRSQRLISWDATSAVISPAFQCPEGYVTLVKSAYFFNNTTTAAPVAVVVRDSAQVLDIFVATSEVAVGEVFEWQGWAVIHPGDLVYARINVVGVVVWISGAVLAGPPQFPPASRLSPSQQPNS